MLLGISSLLVGGGVLLRLCRSAVTVFPFRGDSRYRVVCDLSELITVACTAVSVVNDRLVARLLAVL